METGCSSAVLGKDWAKLKDGWIIVKVLHNRIRNEACRHAQRPHETGNEPSGTQDRQLITHPSTFIPFAREN
jgi:hypothetical protein